MRVIAPDLRGRGRSNGLAGPRGLAAHARDLVAVLDALGVERAVVVGHSMGAFVALVLGDLYPERVSRLVLVDGGLPLDLPDGPLVRRGHHSSCSDRPPSGWRCDSRPSTPTCDFWRAHPAFRRDWSPELEAYLAYDLVGEAPELRPATSYATLEEDSIDQNTGTAIVDALARSAASDACCSPPSADCSTRCPPLYAAERLPGLLAAYPGLRAHRGRRT